MMTDLDHLSKATIGRFFLKIGISALLALIAHAENYPKSMALWVGLYSFFAVVYALKDGQKFSSHHFNYWDEALWLALSALALRIASGLSA
ncbi:MAG: hypothetical protein J0I16_20530 [Rhizobiales bacterium]|nr:hypothetical protein [Hyphomicrobiales bacterium]